MNLKLVGMLVLVALAAIFVLQNANVVELHFLLWQISMSRALMYAVLLLIGIAIGWLLRGHVLQKARRKKTDDL